MHKRTTGLLRLSIRVMSALKIMQAQLLFVIFLGLSSLSLSIAQAADDSQPTNEFSLLDFDELMNTRLNATAATGLHHSHPKGEWMTGYRYMLMDMDGNRDGSNRVSVADVFAEGFMVSPVSMDMEMHMLEAMYGLTNDLTLMVMANYQRLSMKHETAMGMRFETESEGFGDTSLMGIYTFYRKEPNRVHAMIELSLPTGSVNKKDDTPAGPNLKLPYPMQLGSGTYDLILGVTYLGISDELAWGANANGTIRLGRNSEHYSLGNRATFTGWLSRNWSNWFSTLIRVDGNVWGNIDGADPDLVPTVVPTARPDLRGGKRIDIGLGANITRTEGALSGGSVSVEYSVPVYQHLDGPQLELDRQLSLNLRWLF